MRTGNKWSDIVLLHCTKYGGVSNIVILILRYTNTLLCFYVIFALWLRWFCVINITAIIITDLSFCVSYWMVDTA